MIDDFLLDLIADCYVALRSYGYLKEFPSFASFLSQAIGLEPVEVPSRPSRYHDLVNLTAAPPPHPASLN